VSPQFLPKTQRNGGFVPSKDGTRRRATCAQVVLRRPFRGKAGGRLDPVVNHGVGRLSAQEANNTGPLGYGADPSTPPITLAQATIPRFRAMSRSPLGTSSRQPWRVSPRSRHHPRGLPIHGAETIRARVAQPKDRRQDAEPASGDDRRGRLAAGYQDHTEPTSGESAAPMVGGVTVGAA